MRNYFILCSFVICALVSVAQESEYERLYMLSKVWIRSNEEAWTFLDHDLSVDRYQLGGINLYGDSLIIYEQDYDNSTENDVNYIENYFLVRKLTEEELVIHPLNAAAVEFVDPNRGASDEKALASRKVLYKTYLKELKAAGKDVTKRNAVLLKYRTKHGLDVDVISFKPEAFYFEPVKIDSVDVSLTWQVGLNEDVKRIEYNDLRWVSATNSYLFGYRFEDRKINKQVVNGTIEFVPPVVESVDRPEKMEEETPQDSLIRVLNEAPAGWYTGKFAPEGIALIEKALQKYGVNKPHDPGYKENCKYAVRVYHEGKYTDFYRNNWEPASYLREDFFDFLDNWVSYVRTFEKVQDKTIVFPIAVKR